MSSMYGQGKCPPIKTNARTLGKQGSMTADKAVGTTKTTASAKQANTGVAGEYNDHSVDQK